MSKTYTAFLPRNGNFDRQVRTALGALVGEVPAESVTLQAENLEDVYAQLNHGSGRELEGYRGRSLSVGDLVREDATLKLWMVDSCGWKEI